jgi:hypothetical protein
MMLQLAQAFSLAWVDGAKVTVDYRPVHGPSR